MKDYFSEWLRNSNPADILDAAIFFDFRYIHGEISLVQELREHVNQASGNKSVFFYHMAQSVLKMKPHVSGSNANKLDLKKILLPVTTFIRLYSIREKLLETNSIKRLNRIEAVVLKKLLSDISGLQTRLSGEFSDI